MSRLLAKTILPLVPGNAARAGLVPMARVPTATVATAATKIANTVEAKERKPFRIATTFLFRTEAERPSSRA
jgi:hypothetical protein